MSFQSTLQRTLEMMALLSRDRGFRTKDPAEQFELSVRSTQRTIFSIRLAAHIIEEKDGRYKINHNKTKVRHSFDVGDLLHFSIKESWMFQDAISNLPGNKCYQGKPDKEIICNLCFGYYSKEFYQNLLLPISMKQTELRVTI